MGRVSDRKQDRGGAQLSYKRESRSGWSWHPLPAHKLASRETGDRSYSTTRVTFPPSSARLQASSSRRCKFSTLSPCFPVDYHDPPTVSISLSAVCLQTRGFGFEAEESELPDEDVENRDDLCLRPNLLTYLFLAFLLPLLTAPC